MGRKKKDFLSPFCSLSSNSPIMRLSLVLYCPLEFLKEVLYRKQSIIDHYAFCFHDSDLKPGLDANGKPLLDDSGFPVLIPKEPHFHLLLVFKRKTFPSAVVKWFYHVDSNGLKESVLVSGINDLSLAYSYLIHSLDPDKFQYDCKRRISDDHSFFNKDDVQYDSVQQACLDLLSGASPYDVMLKYGRDFVIHQNSIREVVDWIRAYEARNPSKVKRYNDPLEELYEIS